MKEFDTRDKNGHFEEVEEDKSMTANGKYEHNSFIKNTKPF